MNDVHVQKITDGLGFGEGPISFAAGRAQAKETAIRAAQGVIESPDVLISVDPDSEDDGCGDGRAAAAGQPTGNRAKVFGGGAAMVAAMLIGLGQAQGKTLSAVFDDAQDWLDEHGLTFGAHTDDHSQPPKSGCGAIDNAPLIIQKAVQYKAAVAQTIQALGVGDEGLEEVFASFAFYAASLGQQPEYNGDQVMQSIRGRGKLIKQLAGPHQEMYIILNMIPGRTVNQTAIRQAAAGTVQAFGVDVWRLQALAAPFGPAHQQAFLAELVYTLATGAVLTAGDLPVYTVSATGASE